MSLTAVKMSDEVWMSCLTHALSTETEEVMGLLLGDIQEDKRNGTVEALVWAAAPQARADRRKDRVETTPEQLAAAMAMADRLSRTTGNTTRVIGWYHSHPHITVLPSHVDLRTQKAFQMLDLGFVGIIFSCFNNDASLRGRIQAIAFQSIDGHEQKGSFQFASAQYSGYSSDFEEATLSLSTAIEANNHTPKKSESSGDEVVQMLSPGMQEAMHLSRVDMLSGGFVRKEIPLLVLPASTFSLANPPPDPLYSLYRTMFDEEKAAFQKAMQQSRRGQRIHSFGAAEYCLLYKTSLLRIMELCLAPASGSIIDDLQQCKAQSQLEDEEASRLRKKI